MERHYQIHIGDCLETLRTLPDNSVDSIVTDPPYGLSKEPDMAEVLRHWLAGDDYQHKGSGFMGKTWDSFVPGPAIWRECLRVLKPGGHLLAFFGTRTQDMGTLAIRLAGFEIRDSISWVYGSGFPKSMDVSKAIDKAEDYKLQAAHRRAWVEAVQEAGLSLPGNSRHDWTVGEHAPGNKWWAEFEAWLPGLSGEKREAIERIVVGKGFKPRPTFHTADIGGEAEANEYAITTAATDAARQWEGWGTALKPAHEPITFARKPLAKGHTVAANVLAHGTGALNIDGCRVEPTGESRERAGEASQDRRYTEAGGTNFAAKPGIHGGDPAGRWPANLIHDGSDEVVALFPAEAVAAAPVMGTEPTANGFSGPVKYSGMRERVAGAFHGDSGSAARFFKQFEVTDDVWLANLSPALSVERNLSLQELADAIAQSDAVTSALPEGIALSAATEPSTSVTPSESRLIATAVIQAIPRFVTASLLGPLHDVLILSPSPVKLVARREQIGTTTITASLSLSAGSAASITFSIMPKSSEAGAKASKPSPGKFIYCAKASRKDRNEGLPSSDQPAVATNATMREREDANWSARNGNFHPTVKPTDLMAYLCRLVTPPGGVVLDPFMGSGSTGKAAIREGFRFIGCELLPEYGDIARARLFTAVCEASGL